MLVIKVKRFKNFYYSVCFKIFPLNKTEIQLKLKKKLYTQRT